MFQKLRFISILDQMEGKNKTKTRNQFNDPFNDLPELSISAYDLSSPPDGSDGLSEPLSDF